MEVRIYSQDLKFKGISENQTSVLWNRKYFGNGTFEIHIPITDANIGLYKRGNIVWLRGAVEAGIIEDLLLEETHTTNQIIAKGRFLEAYMDRRVIHPTVNFEGKTEVAMRQLFSGAATIPLVELGELQGFTEEVSFQCSWKNLLSYEQKLSQSSNLGFRFRPDFTARKIYFEIYKGLDRTRSQHERNFAEFSDRFDNINTATYNENDQTEKNVAYVGGQGEGAERTIVVVGDDTLSGYERKELFVDAKDLSPDDLTQSQYEANLYQRGIEKLNENILSVTMECVAIPMGNFKYKEDYDLGDIVTTRKTNWNIQQDLRITEIQEVYEHGVMEVVPILGTPLPTSFTWED